MRSWLHVRGIRPRAKELAMPRARYQQGDLFEDETNATKLHPALQVKLTSLLQRLLVEAAGVAVLTDDLDSKGAGDDQDHA
jgi:hypothetical protein